MPRRTQAAVRGRRPSVKRKTARAAQAAPAVKIVVPRYKYVLPKLCPGQLWQCGSQKYNAVICRIYSDDGYSRAQGFLIDMTVGTNPFGQLDLRPWYDEDDQSRFESDRGIKVYHRWFTRSKANCYEYSHNRDDISDRDERILAERKLVSCLYDPGRPTTAWIRTKIERMGLIDNRQQLEDFDNHVDDVDDDD